MKRTHLRRETPLRGKKPLRRGVNLERREPLRPRRRHVWKPDRDGEAFRKTTRAEVFARAGGVCEECRVAPAVFDCHKKPLGMGGNRRDPRNPLNRIENRRALCHTCSDAEELTPGATRARRSA